MTNIKTTVTKAAWRLRVPWVAACVGLLAGGWALAQAPAADTFTLPPDVTVTEEKHYASVLPRVFARDLRITANQRNEIRGSFVANNTEKETVGDLRYEVLVLGPLPPPKKGELTGDTAPVYDRALQEGTFALAPESTKEIPIAYTVQKLPQGTYRFRVQLRTSNDRELGWATAPVTLGGSEAFAVIETTQVETESTDLETNAVRKVWDPIEGVNVNPRQPIVLVSSVRNAGSAPLTATAVLTTKRLLAQGETQETLRGETVTLNPARDAQPLSFPLSALSKPGAYQVILSLQDATGKRVSGLAEYRYVVVGPSASVVKATFEDLKTQKGETAVVQFTVVGAADRVTNVQGTAEVAILDGTDDAGTAQAPVRFRDSSAVAGTAKVVLTRDVRAPGIRVILRGPTGEVLDTYEASFPDIIRPVAEGSAMKRGGAPSLWLRVAVAVLGVIVLLAILAWQRRRGGGPAVPAMLLLAGGLGVAVLQIPGVQASGIQFKITYGTQASVDLWVNQPGHDSTVTTLQDVDGDGIKEVTTPYEVRLEWLACKNGTNTGSIVAYTRDTGGFVEKRTRNPETKWNGQTATFDHVPGDEEPSFSIDMGEPAYAINPAPYWTQKAEKRVNYQESGGSGELFKQSFTFTSNPDLILPNKYAHTLWTAAQSYSNGIGSGAVIDDLTWLRTKNDATCGGITAPDSVSAGQAFSASVTMENAGTRPWVWDSASIPTSHHLGSQDPQDNTTWLGNNNRVKLPNSPMDPGTTATFTFDATAPASPGTHAFSWKMVEDNTEWFGETCTKDIVVTQPDLVTEKLNVPATFAAGDTVTLSGTVRNRGTETAGPSTTEFFVDDSVIGTQATGSLAVNATESESLAWTATAGTHTLEICADNPLPGGVTESDETNNCASRTFSSTGGQAPPPQLPAPRFEEQQP